MAFDMNKQVLKLLYNEPFFAAISRRVNKTETKKVPTAGVHVDDRGFFEMFYNSEWLGTLTDAQQRGLLKHEFYHLLFDHCVGQGTRLEGVDHKDANIATDLAINSHLLGELPEDGCIPGVGMFKHYPVGLSSEHYLKKLQKDEGYQKNKEQAQTIDVHFDIDESNMTEEQKAQLQQAKERFKAAVKEAVEEVQKSNQGWGSVPHDLQRDIIESLVTKVDWRKVLRYFVRTSVKADKRNTVKKLNKRFPYIHAGRKTKYEAKLGIYIDQSGSVSDEMLATFYAELGNLSKRVEFTIIPFDTEVDEQNIHIWKKGQRLQKKRYKSGGTCFQCVTNHANKSNFDAILILTDGEASKPTACKKKRLWVLPENCKLAFNTREKVIHCS
jgi:predicted metal-dependent peptidase